MRYRVKLEVFEGPFDLLLFLIRRNEVDIYDIPISEITDQFLEYIEAMKLLDLNVAGDFIEMVAILMHIKVRLLLPRPVNQDGEEMEDPRTELVERLIEYKRFKEAALEFDELEEQRRKLFPRKYFKFLPKEEKVSDEEFLNQVTLYNLLIAFKRAMDNMPKITVHSVRKSDVTVEQQSVLILAKLDQNKILLFSDLMKEIKEKIVLVVTFVAILELIRSGTIVVKQSKVFDDIRIKRKNAA